MGPAGGVVVPVVVGAAVITCFEQVRTRVRDGLARATYWDHDGYDAHDRLVARYHTFWEASFTGENVCGWRKSDSDGHMVVAHDVAAPENRDFFGVA